MPRLPLVSIIGRPNTGKSSLFNALVGHRRAIVSDVPGTTRDQVAHRIEGEDVDYLLVDTAGIGGGSEDRELEDDVAAQTVLAMAASDLILFTVNSREELTGSDRAVIDLLRKKGKKHAPVILLLTKADNAATIDQILPEYYGLGIADEIIATSAMQMHGMADLRECIEAQLKKLHFTREERAEGEPPRVAIVGKPNVGKSSIVNALMSDPQREASGRLVSDIPGTTRDASDTTIRFQEKEYILVDTAGLRRQSKVDEGIEHYASMRSIQAVEYADVTVLVLDATQPVSRQEKRIASMAIEEGKGLILLLNKSDLLTSEQKKEKAKEFRASFPFCRYAPILGCSAKTRDGLLKLFPLIEAVVANRKRRIATKDLRRWFESAVRGKPLGSLARSKHITQAEDIPPTFVIFVKNPKLIQLSQLRTLDNDIRATFAFEGSPIRWITKGPQEDE